MAAGEKSEENFRINIRSFLDKWTHELQGDGTIEQEQFRNEANYIQRHSKLEPQIISELDVVCGVDTLNCPEEPESAERLLSIDPPNLRDVELSSLKFQGQDLDRRNTAGKYKSSWMKVSKYKDRKTPWLHKELSQSDPAEGWRMPEVLISVQIHRPFKKGVLRRTSEQEVHVVGCQRLTELRDKIVCKTDNMIPGDCSNLPNVQPDLKVKDVYKSGFFFIEGVFYNDSRDPNQTDISRVIRDWAKKEGIGTYEAKNMEEVYFQDLTVTLGHPYLYQHQGQCEHVIIFSDVRLIGNEDCRELSKYPITTLQFYPKHILCRVCLMYKAKWVTRNSSAAPEDPCFYCNTCFQGFHYDIFGKKLFEFRAYHYPDKGSHAT